VSDQRWPWTSAGAADASRNAEMDRLRETDPGRAFATVVEDNTAILRATQAVIAACSSPPVSLDELATVYGSDKWGGLHWYTPPYEAHLGPLRHDPVKVLEIGIGGYHWENLGGQSLHMWQHFFPRGLVYGFDLYAKPGVTGPRIRTIQGDQNDPGLLRELAAEHGPFDVIVDDGSHINEHVRTSYETLFEHVRPGGWYVIEDLQTSYWPSLGGEPPPGSARTSMGLLKDLLDDVHLSEHTTDDDVVTPPSVPAQVSVYHGLAFLRKVDAHERGVPGWFQNRESDVRK
jgi:demethylmacrocin O-methyltransferase